MAHLHGSYHWDIERITAIGLMPLLATTLSGGPSSAVDMALGVVLPLHVHMG
jgi:hypothetical protein